MDVDVEANQVLQLGGWGGGGGGLHDCFRLPNLHTYFYGVAQVTYAPLTPHTSGAMPALPPPAPIALPYNSLVVAVGAQNNTFGAISQLKSSFKTYELYPITLHIHNFLNPQPLS